MFNYFVILSCCTIMLYFLVKLCYRALLCYVIITVIMNGLSLVDRKSSDRLPKFSFKWIPASTSPPGIGASRNSSSLFPPMFRLDSSGHFEKFLCCTVVLIPYMEKFPIYKFIFLLNTTDENSLNITGQLFMQKSQTFFCLLSLQLQEIDRHTTCCMNTRFAQCALVKVSSCRAFYWSLQALIYKYILMTT